MKEIKNNIENLSDYKELAEIWNSNSDEYVSLHAVGRSIVYTECLSGCGEIQFFLDGEDLIDAKKDADKWLEETVAGFDLSENYPIAGLEWGVLTLDELKASESDEGPFKILMAASFSSSNRVETRFSYAEDDKYAPVEFETYEDAEKWLNEENSGAYYLSHGEMGRPEDIITTA